jgi:hypothetical protein
MNVHDYLASAGSKPWRWGGGLSGFCGQDCHLFPADWALRLKGRDPGDGMRGAYDDAASAVSFLKEWGGAGNLVEARLIGTGWRSVVAPMDGDIGVVRAPLAPLGIISEIPAIYAGGLWVIRTLHGQRAASFEHSAVFRA